MIDYKLELFKHMYVYNYLEIYKFLEQAKRR